MFLTKGKITALVLALVFFATPSNVFASHSRVGLGTADNFEVLAGSAINDTTPSSILGNLGLSPASGTFIGVPCTEVNGTIYSVDASGPLPCRLENAGLLTTAKNDLTTGYNDAAGRSTTATIATELGGVTLTDGTYDSASTTFEIVSAGTLTLDGQGNANSVFIFKMGSTAASLVTFANSKVVLTNGAQACNVFWQVGGSATLGTGTSFLGTIMADQSITDNGGSTVNGKLLARIAAVTLNNTTITRAACAAGTTGGSAVVASSSSGGSSVKGCPVLPTTVIVPNIIESRRVDADSIFISWGPNSGIETFNIAYGLENGKWLYSTDVTGFSTTINDLPANLPIWFKVAARSDCFVGTYGEAKLVGGSIGGSTPVVSNPNVLGVSFPNTGLAPLENNISWYIYASIVAEIFVLLFLIQRKTRFSSKH